ncbi:MAG TPA: DUF4160 domain-containing protein [Solirubrobacteraceae bacterium]|nr:DUF4160 domain-containing protein [Solirubrobacteraceae bacterium]
MPRLTAFYGIVIWMYRPDHPPAPFHGQYGQHVAQIELGTLRVLDGSLPPRALRLVRERARLHADELTDDWQRAQALEPLVSIDPLSRSVRRFATLTTSAGSASTRKRARWFGPTGSTPRPSCFTATTTSPIRHSSRWRLTASAEVWPAVTRCERHPLREQPLPDRRRCLGRSHDSLALAAFRVVTAPPERVVVVSASACPRAHPVARCTDRSRNSKVARKRRERRYA